MGKVERRVPVEARRSVIRPVGLDPAGRDGPTRDQAKGKHWRRSSHGLYVPSSADRTPEQRIVEAAATLTSDVGGVTGWAALRWLGGVWFDGLVSGGRELGPVDLAVGPRNQRPQPGIKISKEGLRPDSIEHVDGLRLTSPAHSVAFEMRHARTLVRAVVAFDMALFSDLVLPDEERNHVAELGPATGVVQARKALMLGDENSWSPMETIIRLAWVLGLQQPHPLTNRPVFDQAGHHLGTPDLLDPTLGLVLEYDGRLHLAGEQKAHDLERTDAFRDHGLEVQVIVAEDVFPQERLLRRLDAARRRAGETTRRQSWTVDLPPWWYPDHTVELRRAVTAARPPATERAEWR